VRFLRDEDSGRICVLSIGPGVPEERARWLSQHGIRVRVSGHAIDRDGLRWIEVEQILRAHDHDAAPHGGVVGMAGDRHVELVADARGEIRVCILDAFMQPIDVTGVTGSARIRDRAGNERESGLRPAGDGGCLVVVNETRRTGDDDVTVDLEVRGGRLGMTLPFADDASAGRKRAPHTHP
jgi:hypothetical protein